jgi:WD40 repeat protein
MIEAPVGSPPSPYKGLAAFEDTVQDALFFFGRERETEIIAANVLASRFTVLYGPLGVGKSSVLRAGVVRRLRALAPEAIVVAHDSWAGDPVRDVLRSVALGLDVEAPQGSLADRLAELVDRTGADVLLVLDQFEELFVYPSAAAFADAVAEVVMRPDLRVNVLLALRDDALSHLDVFAGRIPNVFSNYLTLERLDRTAARAAVTGPIERYNELTDGPPVEIEDGLVEAVLDQVEVGRVLPGEANGQSTAHRNGGGRVEVAYLQVVMERLWEAEERCGSRVLRRTTLDELGGAEQIVRAHLEEAIEALEPEQRDMAARVFNHLVTPSGTKIAHGADDLAQYAGVGKDELLPVLTSLGGRRIVRPVDGGFEIFHDVLADAVLSWRTRHDAERELERERATAERRHRRLMVLLATSVAALVAMAAVTIYALTQRSEAREQAAVAREEATIAKANELAAQASVLIPITAPTADPELGLLLAAEAARLSPNPRTVGVLRRALLLSHLRALFPERGVTTASLSKDSAQVVVGTESGVVRVYARDGRRVITTLRLGTPATGASFGPDGRLVLTTERGGPARVWEAATGAELFTLGDSPEAASFSSEGSRILTVDDGGARVWKTEDGTAVATLRQPDPVTQASFGPGGARVVTIGAGALARVFDARTGAVVAVVDHGGAIGSAALIADGEHLVTTSGDRPARIWTLRGRGRLVRELPGESMSSTPAALAPDGDLLVTTASDVVRVWALPSSRLVADLVGHRNVVAGSAFSPDGRSLATWDVDGTALVWDPVKGSARVALAGHGAPVTASSLDVQGDIVLTTSANGRARLWAGRVQSDLDLLTRVPTPLSAATFSDDGAALAVAGPDEIRVLRAADGTEIGVFKTDGARALAVSSDGLLAAAADPVGVSVWRTPGADDADIVFEDGTATALAFSGDSGRLAVGMAKDGIRVVTLGQNGFVKLARPGRVTSVAFSPLGETVAAGFANGTVAAWSLDGRRLLFEAQEHAKGTAVTSVAFDRSGGRLVTAGADSTVRVWDAHIGRALYALRGHYRWVGDAAFSKDGEWIVSAGSRVAGLWDLASRQRFLFLRGHEGRVHEATFDGSGRRITTVGGDGTVREYRCEVCADVPALLRLAERRLEATGRTLTPAEWSRYLGGG